MTAPGGAGPRERLSCCVELRRFGAWRAAIATLASAAWLASLAWAVVSRDTVPVPLLAAVVAAATGIVATALTLRRVEPGTLRSESGQWSFTPFASPAVPESGELVVAIDLGSFMLLSFLPAGQSRRWLPAQRRGLEADWHALRAAVHAPRPPRTFADKALARGPAE